MPFHIEENLFLFSILLFLSRRRERASVPAGCILSAVHRCGAKGGRAVPAPVYPYCWPAPADLCICCAGFSLRCNFLFSGCRASLRDAFCRAQFLRRSAGQRLCEKGSLSFSTSDNRLSFLPLRIVSTAVWAQSFPPIYFFVFRSVFSFLLRGRSSPLVFLSSVR